VFRHGLLRDAAYEMLTDSDRATGHCLAGQWLEQAGEKDALTLADHLERGGELARAVPWLMKAAQTALDGGNVEAAIALGHRGIACGPPNAERGVLRLVQAIGLGMRANWLGCVETMRDAMEYLPTGSAQWFLSAAGAFLAGMCLGDPSITTPVLTAILQVEVEPEPSGPYGFAVLGTCIGLESIGQAEAARGFLRRAEVTATTSSAPDPMFALYLHVARAYLDLRGGDPGAALASLSRARVIGDRIGDVAGRGAVGMFTAAALVETGNCERVEAMAGEVLSLCGPVGLHVYCDWCTLYVATARLDAGRGAEAIAALTSLLERPDPFLVACARALLGQAFASEGDLESAVRESTAIVEQGSMFLHAQTAALAALALVELRRDEPAEGLAFAERGLAAALLASWPRDVALLHLVRAEALRRLGQWEAARNAVREARDRIERVASAFDDSSLRASYLDIETNRRTVALASDWLRSDRVEEAS
jgi:tetratricopeptide (TPR) repeat protein